MYAIEITDLTKVYAGGIEAVSHLSLTVNKGEVFGLLGENGAGKTTTVRMLTTMIKPTSGVATVFGKDVTKNPEEIRKMVGVLPQDSGLYEEFSAVENLAFIAQLQAVPKESVPIQVERALSLVGLLDRKNDRVGTFSTGMKRRVMIARTLIGNPQIIFLDEPTTGVDVLIARRIRDLIIKLKEISTVILCTHNLYEAQKVCDRVGIIKEGKLIALGTPTELIKKYGTSSDDLEDVFVKIVGWNPNHTNGGE